MEPRLVAQVFVEALQQIAEDTQGHVEASPWHHQESTHRVELHKALPSAVAVTVGLVGPMVVAVAFDQMRKAEKSPHLVLGWNHRRSCSQEHLQERLQRQRHCHWQELLQEAQRPAFVVLGVAFEALVGDIACQGIVDSSCASYLWRKQSRYR